MNARTCDWRTGEDRCGAPAFHLHEGAVDSARLIGDLCHRHEVDFRDALIRLGWHVESMKVDGKARRSHRAASGAVFTVAEARAWLIQEGHLKSSSVGRLSRAQLALYAEVH